MIGLFKNLGCIAVASALLLISVGTAQASEVDDILKKVDANLTSVKDQTYNAHLELVRGDKVIKTIKFEATLKGLVMKKIKFLAPGDVRDMIILTTEDGLMYIYMPSHKRVRRVASHVRNQGFMGTDISPDEMGAATLSTGWTGKILKQDANSWVLEMIPAQGNETMYSKLHVTVSKKYEGVEKIESFDSTGTIVKSQVRTEWKSFGPITIPTVMTYHDHKTGSKTVLRFHTCTVNDGVPDSAFTKRSLMRGE